MAWGAGGYLLTPFLMKTAPDRIAALRRRAMDELTTTFASRYTRTIGLGELLDPEIVAAVSRKATGEKFLLNPSQAS